MSRLYLKNMVCNRCIKSVTIKIFPVLLSMMLYIGRIYSQHEHVDTTMHHMHHHEPAMSVKKDTLPREHDQMNMQMDSMDHMDMGEMDHNEMSMSHILSRNLPMERNGSGTAWLPDNSPMYGYMWHSSKWMFMLHGDLFLRYNKQDLFNRGSRGGSKFDAPNMWMFMGQRNVGNKGLFHFSAMVSLDPLTVGESGYPLLFQTGESYKGRPLVDRQHPHDLFSELSVSYAHALSGKSDLFVYVGYPGEPALGPAAFVHRPSGFLNPDAPLTHHWVDATHITFGVITAGIRYDKFKIEGSSFTGREPDENRYNFDKPRFDSWSARISFNPSPQWSLQASHGFITQPEILHADENVNRTTASVQFSDKCDKETFTNITALWGMNKTKFHSAEHGALVEGTYQKKKIAIYGRYEYVQKSIEELQLMDLIPGGKFTYPVQALTGGVTYDIFNACKTKISIGGQLTIYQPDNKLAVLYGSHPVGGEIYFRIFPGLMSSMIH